MSSQRKSVSTRSKTPPQVRPRRRTRPRPQNRYVLFENLLALSVSSPRNNLLGKCGVCNQLFSDQTNEVLRRSQPEESDPSTASNIGSYDWPQETGKRRRYIRGSYEAICYPRGDQRALPPIGSNTSAAASVPSGSSDSSPSRLSSAASSDDLVPRIPLRSKRLSLTSLPDASDLLASQITIPPPLPEDHAARPPLPSRRTPPSPTNSEPMAPLGDFPAPPPLMLYHSDDERSDGETSEYGETETDDEDIVLLRGVTYARRSKNRTVGCGVCYGRFCTVECFMRHRLQHHKPASFRRPRRKRSPTPSTPSVTSTSTSTEEEEVEVTVPKKKERVPFGKEEYVDNGLLQTLRSVVLARPLSFYEDRCLSFFDKNPDEEDEETLFEVIIESITEDVFSMFVTAFSSLTETTSLRLFQRQIREFIIETFWDVGGPKTPRVIVFETIVQLFHHFYFLLWKDVEAGTWKRSVSPQPVSGNHHHSHSHHRPVVVSLGGTSQTPSPSSKTPSSAAAVTVAVATTTAVATVATVATASSSSSSSSSSGRRIRPPNQKRRKRRKRKRRGKRRRRRKGSGSCSCSSTPPTPTLTLTPALALFPSTTTSSSSSFPSSPALSSSSPTTPLRTTNTFEPSSAPPSVGGSGSGSGSGSSLDVSTDSALETVESTQTSSDDESTSPKTPPKKKNWSGGIGVVVNGSNSSSSSMPVSPVVEAPVAVAVRSRTGSWNTNRSNRSSRRRRGVGGYNGSKRRSKEDADAHTRRSVHSIPHLPTPPQILLRRSNSPPPPSSSSYSSSSHQTHTPYSRQRNRQSRRFHSPSSSASKALSFQRRGSRRHRNDDDDRQERSISSPPGPPGANRLGEDQDHDHANGGRRASHGRRRNGGSLRTRRRSSDRESFARPSPQLVHPVVEAAPQGMEKFARAIVTMLEQMNSELHARLSRIETRIDANAKDILELKENQSNLK